MTRYLSHRIVPSLLNASSLQAFGVIVIMGGLIGACGKSSFVSKSHKTNKESSGSASPSESEQPNPSASPEIPKSDDQTKQNVEVTDPSEEKSPGDETAQPKDPSEGGATVPGSNEGTTETSGEGQGVVRTEPLTPDELDPCLSGQKLGKILILDFKSGWFAGDGGKFFNDEIDPVCPGAAKIHMDYLHITKTIVETNRKVPDLSPYVLPCIGTANSRSWEFEPGDSSPETECTFSTLASYSQIWILSGDADDSDDVDISSPLFQNLIEAVAERKNEKTKNPLGIFLGAGLHNTTHSNTIAQVLFDSNKDTFIRNNELTESIFPDPDFIKYFHSTPLTKASQTALSSGTFDSDFFAWKGLTSIFDYDNLDIRAEIAVRIATGGGQPINNIYLNPPRCFADPISNDAPIQFRVLAKDRCNQTVMGYATLPGMRVFVEANLARFYGLPNPTEHVTRIAHSLIAP